MLAARGACILDAPQAAIEDPAFAAALRARGRLVTLATLTVTAAITCLLILL